MSPSEFDWGQAVATMQAIDHKLRNLRMIVDSQDEEATRQAREHRLEVEAMALHARSENESLKATVAALSTEVSRLKVEIRTALSVLGVVFSVLAFLFK